MQDLVFEPNGPSLWERVRDRLGATVTNCLRAALSKGVTLAEAYFVKCDAETNPLDVREAGQADL